MKHGCKQCGTSLNGAHRNKRFCSPHCANKNRYARTGQRTTPGQRSVWYRKRCKLKGYKDKLRLQGKERRNRVQTFIRQFKLQKGCAKCGYKNHHAALEFDHIIGKKQFNVCFSKSIKHANKEIEKCQVLCSHCHKIETFNRCKPDIFEATYEIVSESISN